jgi:tetratricopeptide (TPR) repeat protein
MAVTIEEEFNQSSLFQEALRNFQLGKWEDGFSRLKELEQRFPLEREIRALRQEMQVRARIDLDEKEDNWNHTKRLALIWTTRIGLVWLVLGLAVWGIFTYSSWISRQMVITREKLTSEVQSLDTTVKFNNARNLLQAGRAQEAKVLLQEVAKANTGYPNLQGYMDEADSQIKLQADYEQAILLVQNGDRAAAELMLEKVASQDPNYKDVALQLENLKRTALLGEVLVRADQAYEEYRWEDAIADYESLRSIDPIYLADHVEEQLYSSYIKLAEEALKNPIETLEALQKAEEYFDRALALRPRDAEILAKREEARKDVEERLVQSYLAAAQSSLVGQADSLNALKKADVYLAKAIALRPGDQKIAMQRDMAIKYLSAIENFSKGNWEEVINALEAVIALDQNYADGTAHQTLYEAYVARGNIRLVSGDFELALTDFQQAAILAQQSPNSVLRLFEAQLLVADTFGLLGNYKDAVRLYQAAIELVGVNQLVQDKKSDLAIALKKADTLANRGDFKNSYPLYSASLHNLAELFKTMNVVIESGDYLTMLARRYNTTVSAIMAANDITRESDLKPNTILVIPTLP